MKGLRELGLRGGSPLSWSGCLRSLKDRPAEQSGTSEEKGMRMVLWVLAEAGNWTQLFHVECGAVAGEMLTKAGFNLSLKQGELHTDE